MAYCTSLETIDISIDEVLSQNSEQETIEPTVEENRNQESTLEKGKEKERSKKDLEKIVFGCLREPVFNSPADIYKHIPRWVTFEDELRERVSETESSISGEIGSRENASYSDDHGQFIDDNAVRPSPNTNKTVPVIVVKLLKNM